LIGPERSGTTVHIDPLGTSAWNTLLSGKKLWVLFPPGTPRSIVKGKGLIRKNEDDEAIHYFMTILPRIKEQAMHEKDKDEYKHFRCYEFIQDEGETVFIPNNWWHAVLNLTDTVGVTQNFCSQNNFDVSWCKARNSRKKMSWKWLCKLETNYPHLAARAKKMNERDGYVMKYDPIQVEQRRKEEKRFRKDRKKKRRKDKEKALSKERRQEREKQGTKRSIESKNHGRVMKREKSLSNRKRTRVDKG